MFQRTEFERVTPESVGINSVDILWLLDQLESGFTEPHGLMIMRHGKICAEGWWSPFAPGIRHGEQSHTKTYAATAVGIAYTEGILKLDERIIDIFPDEAPKDPSENLRKLTIRDVLCMGCGMDEMPAPSHNWIHDFLHTPVNHTPGTTYMYNSTGSTLLGAIVQKKTGLELSEYLKTRLFDKIGIDCSNHKWMCMPDGTQIGGGGLFATTEDNLRLMKLYADGGIWNGERILDAEYVRQATTLQNESATEAEKNPPAKDNFVGYGYQIWMCRPKGIYRADGAMGQFTIVVPDLDMIIAITENAGGAHWAQTTLDKMWEFLDRVRDHEQDPAEKSENDEHKSKELKDRMQRLSLPREKYAPYSSYISKINNCSFIVEKEKLYFVDYITGHIMAGSPLPDAVTEFKFEFGPDTCFLTYKTASGEYRLNIATDGSQRFNVFEGALVSQALMSAYWEKENELHIISRWIESCSRQERIFRFTDDHVEIETLGNVFLGSKEPIVLAICHK